MNSEKHYDLTAKFVMSSHVPPEVVNQAFSAYYALQDVTEGLTFPYPAYREVIIQLATHFNVVHEAKSQGVSPEAMTAFFAISAQRYKDLHPDLCAKFREDHVSAFTFTRTPIPPPGTN